MLKVARPRGLLRRVENDCTAVIYSPFLAMMMKRYSRNRNFPRACRIIGFRRIKGRFFVFSHPKLQIYRSSLCDFFLFVSPRGLRLAIDFLDFLDYCRYRAVATLFMAIVC